MIPRWSAPPRRRTARTALTARAGRVAAVTVTALAAALVQPLAAGANTSPPPPPPSDRKLAAEPARHDATREQFYFVLPDRFANGSTANDRGGLTGSRLATGYDPTDKGFYQGGDLKGLTSKLDYIKGLGTTAIWLAPIFKNAPVQGTGADASAGYHGYWITDFTQVDPHFGTNQDLETLISKAHTKGMKVFFDVITNHTADVVDYEQKSYDYLSKGAFPYLTQAGEPFDDADYADGKKDFPSVDADSFPRTPVVPAAKKNAKVPSWLNDPAMYHNRGDSTWAGESATYGDFVGLDDLWTERPEVVSGMQKIYERWVRDFRIDGFRIDTVKHVNMEFWTQWATALDKYAAGHGRDDFFMFGEVYSADTSVTSPYVTQGRLDSTLDFPFQDAARSYASQGGSARKLASVFGDDYKYTTDKANAYEQVTFLGNHDMGRIGTFLRQDNPTATDAELLTRDRLANELMFLSRGNPVVYYGDEQGFTGAGGDKDARQTMFASKVTDYLDDDELGTDRTHASDAYDTRAPLYQQISALAKLRKANPALADGVQTERYAADGPGVYAFSRTDARFGAQSDARSGTEYVVAFNNAGEPKTATFATGSADMAFSGIYGTRDKVTSGTDKKITVTVPAGSAVVLKAAGKLPAPTAKPSLTLTAPAAGATGTVDITADIDGGQPARVVFAAQTGNGKWQTLGSADHAPYRVTQTVAKDIAPGTPLRYKAVVVDSAGRTASAMATSTTGAPPAPEVPRASSRDYAVVHYKRSDGDYTDWRLYAWGDLADGESTTWPEGHDFVGRDAYGAFAYVRLKPGASDVSYLVIDKDGNKDVSADRSIDVTKTGEIWVEQGKEAVLTQKPTADYPDQDTTKAVLHYHRADGNYDGWGLHVWSGAANPTDWSGPLKPVRTDAYGAVYEVPLNDAATSLSYILHKGDEKDLPTDQALDLRTDGHEVWLLNGQEKYLLPQPAGSAAALDPTTSKAVWIDRNTVAWNGDDTAASTQLLYSRTGSITAKDGALTSTDERRLRLTRSALTDAQKAKFPHLASYTAWSVDPRDRDRDRVREALRGQLVASQRAANGAVLAATGVQIAGVLDDLYADAANADLGPTFSKGRPTLSVWAPTAQSVKLDLDGSTVAMKRDDTTGVWSVTGGKSWRGKPYRYVVKVWAPSVAEVVTNHVTDPYSVALTADSERSLVVDLDDKSLAPGGWTSYAKPKAVPLHDAEIQELHVRDFSVADDTVPAKDKGTYRAFADRDSDGSRHLRELAKAGTSYVHLLPVFDIATIPERRADQATVDCDLSSYAADSDRQQACVAEVAAKDAYNWGYDPYHYTVPEGSYASDPDGTRRTVEFRQMVKSLNGDGLRVVMDVVYNHTPASGQAKTSVLDQVVPGYYQRLLADGSVANSTCCANTAPENTMMGKLVVDSIVTWAREYKVDGFRFDLMGHHPKANILAVRKALDALTLKKDGVDGKKIILYGEGWNFGEVADDARFVQATQKNMAGTGIATFSDRARDAVRGGGPFDEDPGVQGFASGLYTDPNSSTGNGTSAQQKARLLHYQDLIKVGLTGNLAAYRFTDTDGRDVTGAQVDYNGQSAGYADAPGDALAYADAHDNESLFDALAFKLPATTSAADRARMQVLAMATATLSQGPALSQAGSDLLRSKSLDRNSYDSGDWFNAIHWNCADGNGFGRGLPMAADNAAKWPYAKPLLGAGNVKAGCDQIQGASAAYQDLLRIRTTERDFSLDTAGQVQAKLSFPLSGKEETPGVITMRLGDLVLVFNATPESREQRIGSLAGTSYALHPVLRSGADPVVKSATYERESGTFAVPGRTVAVFSRTS
ncbi:pullulanase-type alpha-1,6-glucosidase [Streptomyces turgidiscabies]|uniref:1,4-alpha-D-glucan glucanohydrolase n=1 Tax=Streptomyces turgidiscabies (strain Car8) TaxID=698760 RepID=L7EZQ8_STRT8|nr:pullulanase-type alpha-1,6-glucosidase [Streptomyces turgidiscabies]ELP64191.1 alpha amylase, catalytic domain protein [Streptomyces turgidiscabies Car8]MDX3499920.1 pullulanase-type alpha-1,6-glucosidase [Streptomyces turgidiscabies]GAQ76959.1 alpha-amylase precursor [Streptomyces turgidiscabies]